MRFFAVTLLSLTAAILLAAQQPAVPESQTPQSIPATTQPALPPAQSPSPTQPSSEAAPTPSQQPPAQAGEVPSTMPPGTSVVLIETPKERAQAAHLFRQGMKLKSAGKLDEAFDKFEKAAELCPRNVDYITAREFTRQQLVMQALERGNKAMAENNEIVAMAEFRRAAAYDPTNEFAIQRLLDSMPDDLEPVSPTMRVVEQSTPIDLMPSTAHHDFHFRGGSQALLTQVAQAYGMVAEFDSSLKQQQVRFNIDDVNFATAMEAASQVTKTFWVPLSSRQMLFVADTVENRRSFDRMSLRTFYLPDVSSEQQLNEMTNALRVLLNLRYIAAQKSQSTITIRAEQPVVEAAARLLESLSGGTPEVLLEMRVYEVSASLVREMGIAWPNHLTMFNINQALVESVIASLGQNGQNVINQLIASGGINQANSQAIQGLLGQLQNQSTSILMQPFATFGGGHTLFGVTTGGAGVTPTLNVNESTLRTLTHVTLRAGQNDPATLKVGERYPIVNATFAPIYNSPSISQVIGNASYIAPFPSFNFEDLGLVLKATPQIHAERDITLKLELAIRSLGTQTVNGIPIINNREFNGTITVKEGASSVVTGLLSHADALSLSGFPFLGTVPGVTYGASLHNKNAMDDELMVVITPHILRMPERTSFAGVLPNTQ